MESEPDIPKIEEAEPSSEVPQEEKSPLENLPNDNNNDKDGIKTLSTSSTTAIIPSSVPSSTATATTTTSATPSEAAEQDQVRTLFVSGLPMDATARELYLLCRACKGYVDSKLNNARNKYGKPLAPIGFVTFSSREDAVEALAQLQNVLFDPTLSGTIRLEFAKSNTKGKNNNNSSSSNSNNSLLMSLKRHSSVPLCSSSSTPGAAPASLVPPPTISLHPRSSAALAVSHHQGTSSNNSNNHNNGLHHHDSSPFFPATTHLMLPSSAQQQQRTFLDSSSHYPSYLDSGIELPGSPYGDTIFNPSLSSSLYPLSYASLSSSPSGGGSSASPSSGMLCSSNTPSSTLFVANLSRSVTETELTYVFGSSPGLLTVRLYTKGASPVAFVKYLDVPCAVHALNTFQGVMLRNSDRGGIRIEYAKSKMGDFRDIFGMIPETSNNNNINGKELSSPVTSGSIPNSTAWGPIWLPSSHPCNTPLYNLQ